MFDEGIYNVLSGAIHLDPDRFNTALSTPAPDAAPSADFPILTSFTAGH